MSPARRLITLVITTLCACGSPSAPGPNDRLDGDDACVVDACGLCNGDGTSCAPEADIVFVLEVDGATLGVFPFVRGLGNASALVDSGSGIVPGRPLAGGVTLVRPATLATELASWRATIEDGAPKVQTASLTLSDSLLGTIARWELSDAWPSSLELSHGALGLQETLVLTHGGCRRTSP